MKLMFFLTSEVLKKVSDGENLNDEWYTDKIS